MTTIIRAIIFTLSFLIVNPVIASIPITDSLEYAIEKSNDKVEISKLRLQLAWLKRYEDLDQSKEVSEESLRILREYNDLSGLAKAHQNLGVFNYMQSNLMIAIRHFESSEKLLLAQHNKEELASLYNRFGLVYRELQDYEKALNYYTNSLALKKNKPEASITANLINIAIIHYDQKNYQESIRINEQALISAITHKENQSIALIYSNFCTIYNQTGNTQKAISYALKSLDLYQTKINNEYAQIRTYCNLGSTYMSNDLLEEAQHYFTLALELNASLNSNNEQVVILNNLSELAYKSNEFTKARQYSLSALNLEDKIENYQEKLFTLNQLYHIEKKEKEFKKALDYFETHQHLQDSLFAISNLQNTKIALTNNQLTIETIQQEKEDYYQELANKEVHILAWFSWAVLVFFFAYGLWLWLKKDKHIISHTLFNFLVPIFIMATSIMYLFMKTTLITNYGPLVFFLFIMVIITVGISIHLLMTYVISKKFIK